MRRESADFIGARSEAEAATRTNVELQPILFFEDSKVWRKGGRSCRQIYFGLRRIRALAVGLPYALTTAILGGTTEFVALRFKASGHESYFFWYVTIWAPISLLVHLRMPETHVGRAAVSQARLTA
jgi:hypothetical protein